LSVLGHLPLFYRNNTSLEVIQTISSIFLK
jgi:hypothetical protein